MNHSETDDRLTHVTPFSHVDSVRLPLSSLNIPIDYEVAQPDSDNLGPFESRTCWTPSTPSAGVSTRSTSRAGRLFAAARRNPLSQQDEALNLENVIALPASIERVQQVHSHTHAPNRRARQRPTSDTTWPTLRTERHLRRKRPNLRGPIRLSHADFPSYM